MKEDDGMRDTRTHQMSWSQKTWKQGPEVCSPHPRQGGQEGTDPKPQAEGPLCLQLLRVDAISHQTTSSFVVPGAGPGHETFFPMLLE